ncbi:TPA: hypothetical protein WH931_000011 [Neisseria meningitidis]|uniref:hypothetical protein n=1 Tax=Neisseria meningitidis TaxID=487 RepID=UPI0002E9263B|nr:hypothetical protein [Neisseria meningitidis]MBG9197577.1 hypothetical protein [Neisseria meningitidis]MBJ7760943.1 hypothetical protein [Neisseria meningitidis]MCL6107340.1 hypothetical protein [Neisseria meningitidis]
MRRFEKIRTLAHNGGNSHQDNNNERFAKTLVEHHCLGNRRIYSGLTKTSTSLPRLSSKRTIL